MNRSYFLIKVQHRATGLYRYVGPPIAGGNLRMTRTMALWFEGGREAQGEADKWRRPGYIVRTNRVYTQPEVAHFKSAHHRMDAFGRIHPTPNREKSRSELRASP